MARRAARRLAALALLELDGVARRVVLCTPDLAEEYVPQVIRESEAPRLTAQFPLELRDVHVSASASRPCRGDE